MTKVRRAIEDDKDYGSCGLAGIMDTSGRPFDGRRIADAMSVLDERTNGLGGGFAVYGIYPEYSESYALHVMYDALEAREICEREIYNHFYVDYCEEVPTNRRVFRGTDVPSFWRYFVRPKEAALVENWTNEEDLVVAFVMRVNSELEGAFVVSSGKNMGIFKGTGYPSQIAEFFDITRYKGYIWVGHGRFPTNTPGWWGGAHPFGLLDWSVVHNGEISSYGTNKRYLEMFGYKCALLTDTEVITYILDLLVRRQGLSLEDACAAIAPPFWQEIDQMPAPDAEFYRAIRVTYGSCLVNGPFAVIVARTGLMMGLNDRIKLRPLVAARSGSFLYIASEEAAIRAVSPCLEKLWMPDAGKPVIGKIEQFALAGGESR